MRIRIVEDDDYTFGPNGYSIQPCNASTSATDVMDWGETEDYTINIVSSSVGVNDITTNNFSIALNPVNSTRNVIRNNATRIAYQIVNIMGRNVQTGTLNNSEQQINVSKLTAGVYFIQLFGDKKVTQQRFIKTASN
ncbi:MAG TPA: T9SS type A sorting domain-containing protein [Edaphocola sp.]|nr:T9SS type A sorting domain-containing protein [Edaphocola sp.]